MIIEINKMGILPAPMGIMACPAGSADNRDVKIVVKKAFIGQDAFPSVA